MSSNTNNYNALNRPADLLPLSPLDFEILLLLAERALHGYGIVKASGAEAGKPSLELGSLYRIINRMVQQGLIEELPVQQRDTKRKRRYYRATGLGRRVAQAEAHRLRTLLATTSAARLLEEG